MKERYYSTNVQEYNNKKEEANDKPGPPNSVLKDDDADKSKSASVNVLNGLKLQEEEENSNANIVLVPNSADAGSNENQNALGSDKTGDINQTLSQTVAGEIELRWNQVKI